MNVMSKARVAGKKQGGLSLHWDRAKIDFECEPKMVWSMSDTPSGQKIVKNFVERRLIGVRNIVAHQKARYVQIDVDNVNIIRQSIAGSGWDPKQPPIRVEKIPPEDVLANGAEYVILSGVHRHQAISDLGFDELLADVYSSTDELSEILLSAVDNVGKPRKLISTNDIYYVVNERVFNKGLMAKNRENAEFLVNNLGSNFSPKTRKQMVDNIMRPASFATGSDYRIKVINSGTIDHSNSASPIYWAEKLDMPYSGMKNKQIQGIGYVINDPRKMDALNDGLKHYVNSGMKYPIIVTAYMPPGAVSKGNKGLDDWRKEFLKTVTEQIRRIELVNESIYGTHRPWNPIIYGAFLPQKIELNDLTPRETEIVDANGDKYWVGDRLKYKPLRTRSIESFYYHDDDTEE